MRLEIEEIVEEMKEKDRGDRKMNGSEKNRRNKNNSPLPLSRIADLAQL